MKQAVIALMSLTFLIGTAHAGEAPSNATCEGFGPQTPRDIDQKDGENSVKFSLAKPASEMNLCNIHFHEGAEHKAKAFSIYKGEGDHGYGGGYQCGISKELSEAELAPTKESIC